MLRHFAIARSIITVSVALLLALVAAIPAHAQGARAVSLSDARSAPATLVYVYPGGTFTPWRCGRDGQARFSDVSAYRWDGNALGAQHRDGGLTYWQARSGRRVTWDGETFVNHLHGGVLVAGWCG